MNTDTRKFQKENKEIIRSNIHDILCDEQVRFWYANRTVKNGFEKKIRKLIIEGKCHKALRCYEKKALQKRRSESVARITNRIKGVCRRLLGR